MLDQLLRSGLVKDVSILAGAYASIHAIRSMRKPETYECLSMYPLVRASPLARLIAPLLKLEQPKFANKVLNTCEDFVKAVNQNNSGAHGFVANRLSADLIEQVRELVRTAQRSSSRDVMIMSMDYARDELEQVKGVCDEMVRNMLLSSHPF